MGGALTEKPPARRARKTTDQRGMVPAGQWEKSSVHRASAYYCGKCGKRLDSPHDLYDHLDTEHPKRKEGRNGRTRTD